MSKLAVTAEFDAVRFLSLRKLAKTVGMGSHRMGKIAKEPGFPLFEGRVTLEDFQTWYRRRIGLLGETESPLQSAAHPQPATGDNSGEPPSKHGSRRAALLARVRRSALKIG